MLFQGYALRYAAVIFLSALFLLVTGLLVYALFYSPPQEPPRRSHPVGAVSTVLERFRMLEHE